jgi:hypothetical protein
MNDGLTKEERWMVEQIKAQLPLIEKIPNPDKSRCLLGLAYEYFLMDMEEEAYKLLEKADPAYFSEQLGKDMEEMSEMTEIVMRILDKLMDIGVVVVKTK